MGSGRGGASGLTRIGKREGAARDRHIRYNIRVMTIERSLSKAWGGKMSFVFLKKPGKRKYTCTIARYKFFSKLVQKVRGTFSKLGEWGGDAELFPLLCWEEMRGCGFFRVKMRL